MPTSITLILEDEAIDKLAAFNTFDGSGDKVEFVKQRLYKRIQNDVVEQKNREAQAAAQSANQDTSVSPEMVVEQPAAPVEPEFAVQQGAEETLPEQAPAAPIQQAEVPAYPVAEQPVQPPVNQPENA